MAARLLDLPPGPAIAGGLLLLMGSPALAGSIEIYWSNRAYSEAADCLQGTPGRCTAALDRYVDAATQALAATQHPQPGQELRLRVTQGRLLAAIALLRTEALQTVAVAPQAEAEALERELARIDALLGGYPRRREPVAAPPAMAAPVQVVDLLPEPVTAAAAMPMSSAPKLPHARAAPDAGSAALAPAQQPPARQ